MLIIVFGTFPFHPEVWIAVQVSYETNECDRLSIFALVNAIIGNDVLAFSP